MVDLDAVRSQAHAKRRMTVALAVAAAIIAVGLAGIPLVAMGRDTTAPQPAVTPRSTIIFTLPDSDCAAGRCLKPRSYSIPLGLDDSGRRLRARMTVLAGGWEAVGDHHRITREDPAGAVVLSVYQPHEFAGTEPCQEDGATRKVAPDATVDDVVRLLTTLPQFAVVEGPRALPAFGRDTSNLKVRANRVSCSAVAGARYNLAHIYGSEGYGEGYETDPSFESNIYPGRQVLIEFWVLTLEGKPVVIEARQEGSPGDAIIQELDKVRESLTFGIRQ
ncbi:hypothetical protein GCM10023168_21590 [Fodinibacter luteus]|uniref:Uncharacterized protein n=1 Tax=Fodinibacter luteus TaxID=552064 RepID=A0ABP8KGE4_9MICO